MPLDPALAVLVLLVGLAFGSFGNVLIARLPQGHSVGGRSECPHCFRTLSAWELVPIVSYLVLCGRCLRCRHAIRWQYPLVEIATAAIALFAFSFHPPLPAFILACTLWLLFLIAITDARTGFIPDALHSSLLVAAILFAIVRGEGSFLAPVIGASFFAVQWILSRGRAVGGGDIFLAAGIGALLGSVSLVILWLVVSYMFGAGYAAFLLATKKKTLKDTIAFGPFLVVGSFLTLLLGEIILGRLGF